MSSITYKNLFSLTVAEMEKRLAFNQVTSSYKGQTSDRTSVSPIISDGRSDASVAELMNSIQNLLEEALPPTILEGLTVSETTPISASVTISAGKGSVGGILYEITNTLTVPIPLDANTPVFYLTLYKDRILIERSYHPQHLTIAKIVVPSPGTTVYIQDDKEDDSLNAYIVNFKEYKLYGYNDKFEEDTVQLLRNNISPILADNIIGNIRLNEDLKIINSAGTLELNSDSLKLYDLSANMLAKFNQNGVYFYNTSGIEMARFTNIDSRIGNIIINKNAIQSGNFVAGSVGFRIQDTGDVEFSNGTFRGALSAPTGNIGGWTLSSNSIYATTTGTIKTSATAGSGYNGVVIDKDGIRVYDDVLGCVVNLPSDGSAPNFSSGTINTSTYNVTSTSVIRTSDTVGDGTASSAGVLMNNTGLYGCGASQSLNDANFKILADTGNVYLKGEIVATSGLIGNVTINTTGLYGGLIEGSLIRSPIIETSATLPKIRLDSTGFYYQVTAATGKYSTFKYAEGKYGAGVLAFLFNTDYPVLTITAETLLADIHLYDRADDPGSGTGPHTVGDIICVNGVVKVCTSAGSPGVFTAIGLGSYTEGTGIDITGTVITNTDLGTTSRTAHEAAYSHSFLSSPTLDSLSDVMVSSGLADKQVLAWDNGDNIWRNQVVTDLITSLSTSKGGTGRTGALTASQVTGTTDITASASEVDMTDMTTTFTTYGTKLLVIFSAPFRLATNYDPINLYINIDGSNKRTHSAKPLAPSSASGNVSISFQHLETGLTAGSHTVKIRWNASTNIYQKGSTDSERILTVIDLD